jgi:outer membrane protein assembly factor BamB
MAPSRNIYVGLRGSVIALNPGKGEILWSTKLKGSEFVNVVLDGNNLFAATRGEMFCVDPRTGIVRWHNPLKGYGYDVATIAGEGIAQNFSALTEETQRRARAAAASAGTGGGAA